MPRHDPNDGARYRVVARREDGSEKTLLRPTLPVAKRAAEDLMGLDLDGDCYVEVEVFCHRDGRRARCLYHKRGASELRMRRALLALRRSKSRT